LTGRTASCRSTETRRSSSARAHGFTDRFQQSGPEFAMDLHRRVDKLPRDVVKFAPVISLLVSMMSLISLVLLRALRASA
jgi:hypothetical protein